MTGRGIFAVALLLPAIVFARLAYGLLPFEHFINRAHFEVWAGVVGAFGAGALALRIGPRYTFVIAVAGAVLALGATFVPLPRIASLFSALGAGAVPVSFFATVAESVDETSPNRFTKAVAITTLLWGALQISEGAVWYCVVADVRWRGDTVVLVTAFVLALACAVGSALVAPKRAPGPVVAPFAIEPAAALGLLLVFGLAGVLDLASRVAVSFSIYYDLQLVSWGASFVVMFFVLAVWVSRVDEKAPRPPITVAGTWAIVVAAGALLGTFLQLGESHSRTALGLVKALEGGGQMIAMPILYAYAALVIERRRATLVFAVGLLITSMVGLLGPRFTDETATSAFKAAAFALLCLGLVIAFRVKARAIHAKYFERAV